VSMSAKLLQIVNSAFLQPGMHISNVKQAVNLLGIDNVKNLVLMVEVVSPLKSAFDTEDFQFDHLWEHSMTVAKYAMAISQSESDDEKVAYDAFTAGLLHDVGKLILATKMPEKFHAAFELARENHISLFQAEKQIFGATHAQVGGYLLELWGLPDPIVEAITWHDYPSLCPEDAYATSSSRTGFSSLTAVHVANYFCEDDEFAEAEVDHVHLSMLGLIDRMEDWLNLCFST
jgi:putative nucleotidyltransferase with HDIG domain